MANALINNAPITSKLVDLFIEKFDPNQTNTNCTEIEQHIESDLKKIITPDGERILRSIMNLIQSTIRTNYFHHKTGYLTFKMDSQLIADLPSPRPKYEIYVYSAHFEAVHLRASKVARGGIRWSDRKEDFRTEILGLLKAQKVKNSVIVPDGAKGGFVLKNMPNNASKDQLLQWGVACYKEMISAMLELTDNWINSQQVYAPNTKIYDEFDPYLVVAADKGTATFSDTANAIAQAKNFWLGDAFASGGSCGYDHKAMGITARGAWSSVQNHFSRSGKNIATQTFTAVGVGDMSGDVFGNGMLLSHNLLLKGAFNHKHIFIDPNPDAISSFQERYRCFNQGLSWDGYDTTKLSTGGGIFERSSKSLVLTKEIKECFQLTLDEITPSALIQLLLCAPVDLLWFGGIGTYIKSNTESSIEVGDRANDLVRVDGQSVKAGIIAEGANLGMTQLGRIEYERAGGNLNTDAIDNSGGGGLL